MKWIQGSFAKPVLLAGMIAGSGLLAASSFALPANGADGKARCETMHGQKFQAKMEAHRASHLAALKEKLDIKPAQEAAWSAFTNAAKPQVKHDGKSREAMKAEFAKLSTPERLDKMLALSDTRRAKMAERAEAIKTFYAQLTPEQQKVFDAEAMPKRGGKHHYRHHHRHHS